MFSTLYIFRPWSWNVGDHFFLVQNCADLILAKMRRHRYSSSRDIIYYLKSHLGFYFNKIVYEKAAFSYNDRRLKVLGINFLYCINYNNCYLLNKEGMQFAFAPKTPIYIGKLLALKKIKVIYMALQYFKFRWKNIHAIY